MEYSEFVNKIAQGMGLKWSKANEDYVCGSFGKIHWICGHMCGSFWAESCFNGIVIMSWKDDQFAVVENGLGPYGGPDEQVFHRIGTLRQCINTARKLYQKQ